ncbi:hypothetical protein [Natronorubrum daqingense]|uniref:Uncharacterized protein n=1 Tax=Natronorubrum daqingense TaxID=588898 RepID=A0A1N7F6H3_9EURY|nr:hypothetical protein [Natronorubrum daqingense]APX97565.1 hypothetical protein BB347_13630 [Natronorubrum daqingense]SIR95835.1 hypothetical protein SAMN05421809_3043 [Natronorubrum daqingense]
MSDEHTGVSEAGDIPYTYEHVDEKPHPDSDVYRVTCILDLVDRPTHKNTYYVPSGRLESFFTGHSQTGENVIDVTPIDREQAEQELDEYRQ